MDSKVSIMGIRGRLPFDTAVEHFTSMGGDVILLNPMYVYCREQILSAVEHAERAFRNGSNRSKTFLTEVIMYTSGERQVSKALKKMRPAEDSGEVIAVLFDIDDPHLDCLNVVRDDSILTGTEERAEAMGLSGKGPYEYLALELVAMLDIEKM